MGSQRRILVAQFLRYNLVGLLTIILGTAVFMVMTFLGFHYVAALIGDYTAGIVFSYFMNKKFTFRAIVASDTKPFAITVCSYFVTFLLNVLFLGIAVDVLHFNIIISQVIIMAFLAILNFLMFKYVIFRAVSN